MLNLHGIPEVHTAYSPSTACLKNEPTAAALIHAKAIKSALAEINERQIEIDKQNKWIAELQKDIEYRESQIAIILDRQIEVEDVQVKICWHKKAPKTIIPDEEAFCNMADPKYLRSIPEKLIPASIAPDKEVIKADLLAGIPVKGAYLEAIPKLVIK